MKLKHFDIHEFSSPDVYGSGEKMHEGFLRLLDKIRSKAGFSFVINSGYRTVKHNKKVGGVSNSSHLIGRAVDISATDDVKRKKIIDIAISLGIERIGVGNSFIHLDNAVGVSKPNKDEKFVLSVWNYGGARASSIKLKKYALLELQKKKTKNE